MPPRVYDPKMRQCQITNRDVHGPRTFRRICILKLESIALPLGHDQKIQLSPTVGAPEINVTGAQCANDMLQGKPLLGSPNLWVPLQVCLVVHLQQ